MTGIETAWEGGVMDRLNPLDALFVDAEDEDRHTSMAIASIAVFEGPSPSYDEFLMWMICPYDTRVLRPDIVADARRTHPFCVIGEDMLPSASYTDLHVFRQQPRWWPVAAPARGRHGGLPSPVTWPDCATLPLTPPRRTG